MKFRSCYPLGLSVGALWLGGCTDPLTPPECRDADEAEVQTTLPSQGACTLGEVNPGRLLLTTTDFSTGALAVVDSITGEVAADVASTSTDAIPFWHDGNAVVVNRFQHDYLQLLDPARAWANAGEFGLPKPCDVHPNPQAVAFHGARETWVTQLAVPEVLIMDLSASPAQAVVGRVNLGVLQDDGNPEANLAVACGDTLWVALERLDPSLARVGPDELVAIDMNTRRIVDLGDEPGVQGLVSRGAWLRQLRRDPGDTTGLTLLGLSTGIERFDLERHQVAWAVEPDAFAQANIGAEFQPQAFAVDATGGLAYVAAYDPDYGQVQLYRVGLDGREPRVPQSFAAGFDSVERSLELVGNRLWYGSTRAQAPGLWAFDVDQDPIAAVLGPIPTGLPPYSMVAIP